MPSNDKPEPYKPVDRTRKARYATLDHRNHREAAIKITPYCEDCLKEGRWIPGTQLDHVIPIALGGTNTPDNYSVKCAHHHSVKTARENK